MNTRRYVFRLSRIVVFSLMASSIAGQEPVAQPGQRRAVVQKDRGVELIVGEREQDPRGRPPVKTLDRTTLDRTSARQRRIEETRERLQAYMDLRVDELDRICDLTDTQRKKLSVAAKGSIERLLVETFPSDKTTASNRYEPNVDDPQNEAAVRELAARARRAQLNEARAAFARRLAAQERAERRLKDDLAKRPEAMDNARRKLVEEQLKQRKLADEANNNKVKRREIIFKAVPAVPAQPARRAPAQRPAPVRLYSTLPRIDEGETVEHEIWTKAIKNTLTAEQKSRYDKALQQRRAFRTKAAVDNLVARIDEQLLLSADQRIKLTEVVASVLEEQQSANVNADQLLSGMPLSIVAQQLKLPGARLNEILSQHQRDAWRQIRVAGLNERRRRTIPGYEMLRREIRIR